MRQLRSLSPKSLFVVAAVACATFVAFALSAGTAAAATCQPPPSSVQPNALDPATDDRALYLPAGSSATSPCTTAPNIVGLVRFFAKGASTGGRLKVEVLVKGNTYLAGTITAWSGWAPAPMLFSNAPAYKGAVGYQVRLTASGAAFTVDDVYFDPYSSK
jgi:hypothetical protein